MAPINPISNLPPFPKGGVLLKALQALRDFTVIDHPEYTTTEVSDNIVKPWTEEKQYSLYQLIEEDFKDIPHLELKLTASEAVGPRATVFVSHAWRYKFQDLVAALECFFEENKDFDQKTTYFWVDLFLNNQHTAPSLPFEWWSSVFRDAIIEIGHTCLVLNPWKSPIPLTRVWCLWEIFCTCSTTAKLTVQLNTDDQLSFNEVLCSDMASIISTMSEIDVEQSEAWNPMDKSRIFAAVRNTSGGFQAVNVTVMNHMREWVLNTAQSLLKRLEEDPDYTTAVIRVSNQLALLYKSYGEFAKSEVLSRKVIDEMEKLVGPDHKYIMTPLNNLGSILQIQGKLEEAETYFRRAFDGKKIILGATHQETILTSNNLGAVLLELKRSHEALAIFREALDNAKAFLGREHTVTVDCMHNLAMAVRETEGDAEEVLELARAAYEASVQGMGATHPSTCSCLNNVGTVLLELCNRPEEAEIVHKECLAIRERVLGETHPHTLESLSNLAVALQKQGATKKEEAEMFTRRYYSYAS